MSPELFLLILAFAFMTAAICHLVIAIKRLVCDWLWAKWSETLDGWAASVR